MDIFVHIFFYGDDEVPSCPLREALMAELTLLSSFYFMLSSTLGTEIVTIKSIFKWQLGLLSCTLDWAMEAKHQKTRESSANVGWKNAENKSAECFACEH